MNTNRTIKPYDQRLANLIVRPLVATAIHPNHLTTLTLTLGLCSALLFALQVNTFAWLAALLYMLAVFSDHLDGELARMTGKTSGFGHKYDYIVGGVNYTLLFSSIGYGLSFNLGAWTLILGLIAGLSNPLILYLRMRMESCHGPDSVEHPALGGFELEDGIYLIGPITWLAGIVFFFIPYALGTIGYLVWTILQVRRWKTA